MAVLKDLIVHGRSHFINGAQFNTINARSVGADAGIFNKLVATSLEATTASIDDLTAKNATVTALLDVQGDMHTNSWSNSNIATIDGSFYITPTSVSSDGSNIDASNYTPTGTITYANSNFTKISITGTFDTSQLTLNDNAHVAWPANSEVIVTGDVLVGTEWLPLGTIRGKLESQVAATNASKTISVIPLSTTLTDGQGHMPVTLETIRTGINLSSGTSTALKMRKVKVSLTSRASGSTQYPVGILLSAQGTGTGQTFIDIYGGNNARNGQSGTINGSTKTFTKPMVRLGNLEGLPSLAGQTPSGWGIYTSNGFFEGAIVAKEGYIGNTGSYWTIGGGTSSGATYMYSGPSTVSATSTAGTYLGTNGFLNTASSTTYAQITNGVLTAQGAVIQGTIDATSFKARDTNKVVRAEINLNGLSIYDNTGTATIAQFGQIHSFSNKVTTTIGEVGSDKYNLWMLPDGLFVRENTTLKHFLGEGGLFLNQFTSIRPGRLQLADTQGQEFVNLYSPGVKTVTQTQTFIIESGQTKRSFRLDGRHGNSPDITLVGFTLSNWQAEYYSTQIEETSSAVACPTRDWYDETSYATYFAIDPSITGPNELTVTYTISIPITQFTLGYVTGDRIELNNDGMQFFKAEDASNPIIEFGTTNYIGKHDGSQSHLELDYHSLKMIDANNLPYVHFSDTETETFELAARVAYANDTEFKLSYPATRIDQVKIVSGAILTDYELINNNQVLKFSSPPVTSGYETISIQYYTKSNAKIYTLGVREVDSELGLMSVAEGSNIIASGECSHAEGKSTRAAGTYSHAEGAGARALGIESHAEGYNTEASGSVSHAEGGTTKAVGKYSHAEGYYSRAEGQYSHAQNYYTITKTKSQTTIGEYNIIDTGDSTERGTYSLIIGNGTDNNNRSNALTVDWNGNLVVSGNVNSADMTTSEIQDFVDNLESGGGNGTVDRVIEQGTSGIWTYRKWESGIAECWGTHTATLSQAGSYLGGYSYQTSVNFPSGLFADLPVVTYSAYLGNQFALTGTINNSFSLNSVALFAICNNSGSKTTSWFINAKGRWK